MSGEIDTLPGKLLGPDEHINNAKIQQILTGLQARIATDAVTERELEGEIVDKINRTASVATISALSSLTVPPVLLTQPFSVQVQGYYAPGDGGGGTFMFDATSDAADNGGTVIAPNAGTGRWLRIVDDSVDYINVKWFGVKVNDPSAGALNHSIIQGLINSNALYTSSVIYFPAGTIHITGNLVLSLGVSLLGAGSEQTNLRATGIGNPELGFIQAVGQRNNYIKDFRMDVFAGATGYDVAICMGSQYSIDLYGRNRIGFVENVMVLGFIVAVQVFGTNTLSLINCKLQGTKHAVVIGDFIYFEKNGLNNPNTNDRFCNDFKILNSSLNSSNGVTDGSIICLGLYGEVSTTNVVIRDCALEVGVRGMDLRPTGLPNFYVDQVYFEGLDQESIYIDESNLPGGGNLNFSNIRLEKTGAYGSIRIVNNTATERRCRVSFKSSSLTRIQGTPSGPIVVLPTINTSAATELASSIHQNSMLDFDIATSVNFAQNIPLFDTSIYPSTGTIFSSTLTAITRPTFKYVQRLLAPFMQTENLYVKNIRKLSNYQENIQYYRHPDLRAGNGKKCVTFCTGSDNRFFIPQGEVTTFTTDVITCQSVNISTSARVFIGTIDFVFFGRTMPAQNIFVRKKYDFFYNGRRTGADTARVDLNETRSTVQEITGSTITSLVLRVKSGSETATGAVIEMHLVFPAEITLGTGSFNGVSITINGTEFAENLTPLSTTSINFVPSAAIQATW
jgi:hypothetical protein